MNITHPTQQSPLKRNGSRNYVQRYLNTLSDWQTYAGVDVTRPDALGDTLKKITADYFSPKKLKGIALLFAAHLAQQAVAGLATTLVRSLVHGAPLDSVKGIVVRQSNYHAHWNRLRPEWIARCAEMTDSYYFHEGGRTWTGLTMSVRLWGETRQLSVLSLFSFPNRVYYFDRALAYPQAVPLALGLTTSDSLEGFIGDTNELDALIPPLRSLKLMLYLFNWLLVDPAERDNDLPSATPYSDLTPPPASSSPHYPATPPSGRNYYGGYGGGNYAMPYGSPYPNGNGIPAQNYTAPYPNGNGISARNYATPYPNGNGIPAQNYATPYPNGNGIPARNYATPYPNGNSIPAQNYATSLTEQAVAVLIKVDGREAWHTIRHNAWVIQNSAQKPTGLALTPHIESLADGRIVEHDTQWHITHLGSGRQLDQSPLPTRAQAHTLANALLVVDWTRAVDDIPARELELAQNIIGGSHVH